MKIILSSFLIFLVVMRFSARDSEIVVAIGKMAAAIASRYFTESSCNVLISENAENIAKYVSNSVPLFNIRVSPNEIDEIKYEHDIQFNMDAAKEIWSENVGFEDLLLHTLNEGCSGYIIHVSNPINVIRKLSQNMRMALSRKNRKYLVLPWCFYDDCVSKEVDLYNVFTMTEMNFMPHLNLVRISGDLECEINMRYPNSLRGKYCEGRNYNPDGSFKKDVNNHIFTFKDINMDFANSTSNGEFTNSGTSNSTLQVFTHVFVGEKSSDLTLLDIWSVKDDDWVFRNYLYPEKVTNLLGKQLTFISFTYLPYSVVDLEADPPVFDGTDFLLAIEFCRKLNASWKMHMDPDNMWGEVWENGSGNGISGVISEDKADVGFGSMYVWYHEYRFVDFTYPYYQTAVTCLVPKPKLLPTWMTPVLPFTWSMWTAVAASLIGSSFAIYSIDKISHKYLGESSLRNLQGPYSTVLKCIFRAVGMLVTQPPPAYRNSGGIPVKHLVSWLMIFFLLVSSCYSGGFASILTVPRYEPPVDTTEDLAQSGFHWAANHEAWVFSIKDATDNDLKTVTRNFRVYDDSLLNEKSTSGELAYGIERLAGNHYAVGQYLTQESVSTLRLMKGNLYTAMVAVAMRKGSPYMEPMNGLIHRLLGSGVLYFWEGEIVRKYQSETFQIAVEHSAENENKGPTKIRVEHVIGALYLLCIGYAISTLAFSVELAYRLAQPAI